MDEWLNEVDRWVRLICDASLKEDAQRVICGPLPAGESHDQGQMAAFSAGSHAHLAAHTGQSAHYDKARDYLLLPVPVAPFSASGLWKAVTVLRAAGALTEQDERRIEEAATRQAKRSADGLLNRLYGMRRFNHAVTTANLCDIVGRLWPDASDADGLLARADDIWGEWWLLGENIEGTPNYEAFLQIALLQWADRRGERERTIEDPMTRGWMDRGIEHLLPMGVMPGFGDTCTMELWPDWFALYAIIATWADGSRARRARWAAERLFEWVRERGWLHNLSILDTLPDGRGAGQAWHQIPRTAWFLAVGHDFLLSGGMDVEPEPPASIPVVTHRWLPTHDHIHSNSWSLRPVSPGQRVPDKVVLRLGGEPQSATAMIGCSRQFWHDHLDGGAIISYAPKGVILLDDSGYLQKLPEYHNLFWAERADRGWIAHTRGEYQRRRALVGSWGITDFQVRGLTGERLAQMTTLFCDVPHGLPIRQQRTVLLSRNGPMIVFDRVVPLTDGLVGSPLWHAQTVHRQGRGWAEVSVDEFRGMNGPWMPNGKGRLLIVDPLDDRAWETMILDNDDAYGTRRDAADAPTLFERSFVNRTRLFHRRSLVANEPNIFVTVLLPAEDIERPGEAVRPLNWSASAGGAIAVGGGLFAANDGEVAVSGSWGSTDAKFLWYEKDGLLAHRVRRLELPGVTVESGPCWADMELTFGPDGVGGMVSAEQETRTRIRTDERESLLTVRGITPIAPGTG